MLPEYHKYVGGFALASFAVFGTLLNSLCLFVLLSDRKLRAHPTTILVIALTCSDLFHCSVVYPSLAVHYLDCWFCFSGSVFCSSLAFLLYWNHLTLLQIQAALAVNRWAAVCTSISLTTLTSLIGVVWSFSFSFLLLLLPLIGVWGNLGFNHVTGTCNFWGIQEDNNFDPSTIILSIGLGLPYTVIFVAYSIILKKIRKTNRKIEDHGNCMRSRLSISHSPALGSSNPDCSTAGIPQAAVPEPRYRSNHLAIPQDPLSVPVSQMYKQISTESLFKAVNSTPVGDSSTDERTTFPSAVNVARQFIAIRRWKRNAIQAQSVPQIVEPGCSFREKNSPIRTRVCKGSPSRQNQPNEPDQSPVSSNKESNIYVNNLRSLKDLLGEETLSPEENVLSSSFKYILKNIRPESQISSSSNGEEKEIEVKSVNVGIVTSSASVALSLLTSPRVSYIENLERQHTIRTQKRNRQELNLTFTVGVILTVNIVCHLPALVVLSADPQVHDYPKAHLPSYCFVWVSAIINPMVYVVCNPSYRSAFRRKLEYFKHG